jgi:WD40 repeat protein
MLYCPACGAANAITEQSCFACQQSLGLANANKQPIALLRQRYEILAQVGQGGFGAVYKARDTQEHNRLVAIKQINLRGLTPQEMIDATDGFNREVQILSALAHAHLPRMYAHFTDPDHWYVVMDFIEGETLEEYVRDRTSTRENAIRALPLDEVLDIGLQLCDVLAYLHSRQPPVIFRDLKPSNLIRTARGQLYLIDFGIARYFKPGQSKDTMPLGSPGYAAPEQYGRAQTDPRADIYSLGALLHHLLSRHDPAETPFTFAPLRLSGSPELAELDALITRMVAADVALRPVSVREVELTLSKLFQQHGGSTRIWRPAQGQIPPAPGSASQFQYQQSALAPSRAAAQRKKSRRKFLLGGLATASALTLGGSLGGFGFWKYWHPARLTRSWQIEGERLLQQIDGGSVAANTAWSPDGQYVAFAMDDGNVRAFVHDSFGMVLVTDTNMQGTNLPAQALAWSDKNVLAAALMNTIWILDQTRTTPFTFGSTQGNIQALAWLPGNDADRWLAAVDDQGGLYVYNPSNGQRLWSERTWSGYGVLACSPNGVYLATQATPTKNYGQALQIWNVDTGQLYTVLPLNTPGVSALAWAADSQSIAVLSVDGTLQVWNNLAANQGSNQQVYSQLLNAQQNQLAWSPDQHFLATIDDAYNLLILDRSNGSTLISFPLTTLTTGSVFSGQALSWLPDSQSLVLATSKMDCQQFQLSWF